MAGKFEISAEKREVTGKGASRRLRRIQKLVPGIVYGAGKEPTNICVNHDHIVNAIKNEAFYSHILTLTIDGKAEKVVIKDLQRHPSKAQILHMDFQRISDTEKLYMNIPLHFVGEDIAPGVKLDNGLISHLMNEVEIRCLPADLPEFIEVDISHLGIDQSIHLSELKIPNGVEIVALSHGNEYDQAVVSIHRPSVAAETEEVVAPPAEVPVVGKEAKPEEAADKGSEKK